ncbi:MAG: D-amino-acid transaminase [Pseudomonadota bacterium]
MSLPGSIAYLNGEYSPLEDCKVSALDRGFIFGDAIYELIPVYNGKAFYLDGHLTRLKRSLDQIEINSPYDDAGWTNIINQLVQKSGLNDLYVYIQVTRGVAPRDHAFPANATPTVFAMIGAWPSMSAESYVKGLNAVTVKDMRWDRCDIKVTSLLANVLKKQKAAESDAHEAIIIRDGMVLEGSASNVFVVKDHRIHSAPKNNLILPGITRDVVVDLINENNLPLTEQAPTEEILRTADEVWITSSTKECMPVTTLDGKAVGSGNPGPLWKKVFDSFQARKLN